MLPLLPSSLQALEQEDSPCLSSSQPGSPPAGKVTASTASITGRNRGETRCLRALFYFSKIGENTKPHLMDWTHRLGSAEVPE